jgi:hypothetical protein
MVIAPINDELGHLPLEPNAACLFFQLISRCYQRGSVLITSNSPVMEWVEVFGDQVVATAILDRLLHHSHVLTIRGDSYRLRETRRSGLIPPQAGGWGCRPQRQRHPTHQNQIQEPLERLHQSPIRWTSFRVASGPKADVT